MKRTGDLARGGQWKGSLRLKRRTGNVDKEASSVGTIS